MDKLTDLEFNDRLRKRIQAFWRAKGRLMECKTVPLKGLANRGTLASPTRGTVHGIRSKSLNGMPL